MSELTHDTHDVEKTADGLPASHAVDTQVGVLKVEAATRVWGKYSKIALWFGIAVISYIYSLDGTTTWQYAAFATSEFSLHSLLGAVGTAQAITIAISKPVAAKVSDVFGRAEAMVVLVVFYVVGYIVVASSNGIHSYAAGALIYIVGYASLQIMLQIIIGDVTSLRWRSFLSSCVSVPFFINFAVASNIGANVNSGGGWRWGYGMFCIIIPAGCAPIIGVLFWAQRRAKQLGVVATNYGDSPDDVRAAKDTRPIMKRFLGHLIDLDAFGLLLFAAGWACLLLPLTLVNRNTLTWKSGNIIAMLVLGPIILAAFGLYEYFVAPRPLFPTRFWRHPTILACAFIGFFDFVSFYLQYTYQYSFIYIVKSDWSLVNQNYFAYTQTLTLTFGALAAGLIQAYIRRAKWLLTAGLCVRLLGVGLMIKSKGARGTTAELVIAQVLQGLGGGVAACSTQTIAQGSVAHQDLASVTAFLLLIVEIGNAVGTAIASAIWKNEMPKHLATRLAGILNSTEIAAVFGSISTALTYEGTAAYEPIVEAYTEVMKILLIAAVCLAVIPIFLSLTVKDIYLGDGHNAVEFNNDGSRIDASDIDVYDKNGHVVKH